MRRSKREQKQIKDNIIMVVRVTLGIALIVAAFIFFTQKSDKQMQYFDAPNNPETENIA